MVTLTLSESVPDRAARALRRLSGVTVVRAPRTALISDEEVLALDVHEVGLEDKAVRHGVGQPALLLIVGVLSDEDAARLEDLGQAFVDGVGRAWVPGAPRSSQTHAEGQTRARHQSIRAAQLLADHPDRKWSGGTLAEAAGVGRATAERLLQTLTDSGLVARHGRGRASFGTVDDIRGMRRWLMRRGRRQRHVRLSIFVRDLEQIPTEVGGVRLVRSGSYGAGLIGMPVLSAVPRPLFRVELVGQDLEALPAELHGMRTTSGANAMLVADPGGLASLDAREVDGVWIAPPSRLALDMTLEPRGDAAADIFLELWDDRIV